MKMNAEQYLYTSQSIVDACEYKQMVKYFPKSMYWVFVLNGLFWNLLISAIIAIASRSLFSTLFFLVICQIYFMIYYKVRLEQCAERVFNTRLKKGMIDTNFEMEYYDDYFIRKGEMVSLTIKYCDITKFVETESHFYLEYSRQNTIIIIQKERCHLELLDFIREKFRNIENRLEDGAKLNKCKKQQYSNFIKPAMIVLFVLTIASFWGALWTQDLAIRITNPHGFNFVKTMWVFWCWLPIPILSIVLGFKYKKAGFKCTKNIVGGFIIGFFLLIYGTFCLFPTFSEDYNKIDNYRAIIDAKLPEDGELEIQDWNTYSDEDKTEYSIINVYYDREDTRQLVQSIEDNENWILSSEINSELQIFIPSQLRSDTDAYFSIYNKTTNQYNIIPGSTGDYEIYAMKYDKSDKQLEIHKFKIRFKQVEEDHKEPLENLDYGLTGVNKFRVDYDLGTCRNLSGNVSVVLFYMDDFESSWTPEEITNFTNDEVKPGLAFLEKEAKQHGINLNLNIKQIYSTLYYDGEVIISIKQTGLATVGVLNQAAYSLNYSSDLEMITDFKSRYQTEVVCFTIFNKNGTAYAINPPRGETEQIEEHCIIFAHDLNSDGNDSTGSQSSVVAHEVLHLFGAEDFYTTSDRKSLAKKHYPSDIMLSAKYCIGSNNIGDATAFYIGWTDKVPDVLYNEKWF